MAAATITGPDRALVDRAVKSVDRDRVGDLVQAMTAIPSPTGEELALAEFVASHLGDAGVEATVQRVGHGGASANVIGTLRGRGGGVRLMLYAPLDTAFSGDQDEDAPWLGQERRADFALPPRREGPKIIGLGAENPKAFAASGIAALEALASSGAQLRGDVVLALAGGTMPVNARPGSNGRVVGHGVGIRAILDSGPRPDFAIVLKPGYAVAHEEVGLAWFRITVGGAINYTGIRHKGPYRDPIVAAARLVTKLEAWFAEYTEANRSGLVAPQGSVNAIRGGSRDRAAFIPRTCEIDLDLRVAPDSSPDDVQRQLEEALAAFLADDPELELELERTAALPGTRTDPGAWIVRSLIRTWEALEGRPHATLPNQSGAAFIRAHGIPTARIGLPPPSTPSPYPGFSMGVADVESIERLTGFLIHAIVDTAARPAQEVSA
jgi:succinyl-diaminopimelate desuccinylase